MKVKSQKLKVKSFSGFTIIELLVVITIIGVLGAIGLNSYQGTQASARDAVRRNDISKLSTALEVYFQKEGKYPLPQLGEENCNRDTNNFFTKIKPYLTGDVPKDPKTQNPYCYIAYNKGASYRLFAKLENIPSSSESEAVYPTDSTKAKESAYNYSKFSEDLTLAEAPGGAVASNPSTSPSSSPNPSASAGGSSSPSPGSSSSPDPSAGPLPIVTTSNASSVAGASVTLNGTVNPNGSSTIAYFAYGITDTTCANLSSTVVANSPVSGTQAMNISANLQNLANNTRYYFCAVGTQLSSGTRVYGEKKNFTTLNPLTHRVFVTYNTYDGNLGGLSGADAKCQTAANSANLGGSWKAWLSSSTTSAASRLSHSEAAYVLTDNSTVVANNWFDMTTLHNTFDYLRNPINITEYNSGLPTSGASSAFTNTNPNGEIVSSGDNCQNWTTNNDYFNNGRAIGGYAGSKNSQWTNQSPNQAWGCNYQARLYCFEDTPAPEPRHIPSGLPTDPSNLTASAVSSSQINLSWTAPADAVSQYQIWRCIGASCTNFSQISSVTTTSYSNSDLSAATTYKYQVRAQYTTGSLSNFSNFAYATIQASTTSGCADGTVEQSYASNMVGCNGSVRFEDGNTLCGSGWSVCSAQQYLERGGRTIPSTTGGGWLNAHAMHTYTSCPASTCGGTTPCNLVSPGISSITAAYCSYGNAMKTAGDSCTTTVGYGYIDRCAVAPLYTRGAVCCR